MIFRINKEHYKSIYKLIKNVSHGIFPGCVSIGHNPGFIYVDNKEQPKSAFVYTCGLGGTLVGDWNNTDFNSSFIL